MVGAESGEISGFARTMQVDGEVQRDLVLYDSVPGGAGYVRKAAAQLAAIECRGKCCAAQSAQLPGVSQILVDAQIRIKRWLFGQVADVTVHVRLIHRQPENPRCPRRGEDQVHEKLEGTGLPRAVRSQEAEDLVLPDLEGQRIQGAPRALAPEADQVILGEVFRFNWDHGNQEGKEPAVL